ncbi:MAG: hypothetical protein IRZ26_07945, partial [Clostridia bacterium]|nr:hypothetical protein [Clostridia bacterium]
MDARGWWRGAVARVAAAARRAVAARAARGRPGAGRRLLGWLGATVARRWLLPLAGAALAGLTRAWLGRRRRAASWPGGG